MLRSLILIILITGSGCTRTIVTEPAPLPLPNRPNLLIITDQENISLKQFNPELHNKLLTNDQRLKAYTKELEAVINSTR